MDAPLRRRAAVFGVVFAIVFAALFARLYAVQIVDYEKQSARQRAQSMGRVDAAQPRGAILDADGQVLAVSVPAESVWVDPLLVTDRAEAARLLARTLGLREAEVRAKLEVPKDRFAVIKKQVSEREAENVKALRKSPAFGAGGAALGLRTEFVRRYPHGSWAGQILGFVSGDPAAHEGVERTLNTQLGGSPGKPKKVLVDGRRKPLDGPEMGPEENEVQLTISLLFQRVVEEALDEACREHAPKWAAAVAMDPRTGAILAVANRPAFDPNDAGRAPVDARRNRAVVDPYEPGSTFKPFVAAYALDLGLVTPETRFDCENGAWKHGKRTLHDHHPYGTLTLLEVIVHSSNIGAAKLGTLVLGPQRLHEGMARFGFGTRTGVDLPAESGGVLRPLKNWDSFTVMSVPIGHEISVTPLQLVAAMSAIANKGVLMKPFVVRRVVGPDGTVLAENGPCEVRRVVGEKAAAQTVEMLKVVVKDGTGTKAQVAGLDVAGKTGTTQKVDPATRAYSHEKFISSFVGFAPADSPKVCVAVVIDEPEGAYYGGAVAAPVVGRILERGLVHVK